MDFLTMQQELADRLSAFDETISSDQTRLQRWLNIAYKEICSSDNWPFLTRVEIIQTTPDYTTGTASVSSGSSSVTLSVAPSVSMAERYIKFSSSDNWYRISAHTAATTTLTITPSYGPSSNFTSGTFTIRRLYYALSSDTEQIINAQLSAPSNRLESLSAYANEPALGMLDILGAPEGYFVGSATESGKPAVSFYPTPDTVYNVYMRSKKIVTELSANTDLPLIPVHYHSTIVNLASYYGFHKLDDNRANDAYRKAQLEIEKMRRSYSGDSGKHRIMRAIDSDEGGPAFSLPPKFGPTYHY